MIVEAAVSLAFWGVIGKSYFAKRKRAKIIAEQEEALKKEMLDWSEEKLYAFAGMKHLHGNEIRTYAHHLAKEKAFLRLQ